MEKEEVRSLRQYIEMFQSTMKKETVPQDIKFTLKDTLFALHESKAYNLIEMCIGFTGGQVVFDNDVVGSVISCEYTGDTIDIPEDKTFDESSMVIRVYKRKADELTLIPVSAVNFIKVRQTKDINWRHEWEQLSQENKDLLSDYYQKIGREYYLQNQKSLIAKKENKCCGNCFWFDNEDAYGQGWCIDSQDETSCDLVCDNHLNR